MTQPPLCSGKEFIFLRKFVNNSRYDTPWLPTPAVLFTFIRGNLSLLYVKMLSRGQQSSAEPASCTAHRIFMAKRTSLAVLIRVLFSKVRISICVKFWCGRNVGNDHPQNHKCHCGRNVFLQTLAWIKPDLLRRCQKQTPPQRIDSYFVQIWAQSNRLYTREEMAWQATPAAAAKAHLSNFNIHFLNFVHCQPDTFLSLTSMVHSPDFLNYNFEFTHFLDSGIK